MNVHSLSPPFSQRPRRRRRRSLSRTIGLIITFFITGISTADFVGGQKPWAGQPSTNPVKPKPSHFPPVLKVDSFEGYLPENAEIGTTVRIAPSIHSASLQILVDDQDLKPGMPPAIYQYILTGYGAEKFAVDQRGFLFLNSGVDIDADQSSSTFMLHVLAREVDTTPMRSSDPISLTIHIMDVNDNQPSFAQQLYAANVSAGVTQGMERTIAKLEAKDIDAGRFGQINYRIIDVKGGPATSFRYDSNTHELKTVGPLVAGQKYQITLEAVDGGGLVGRTSILVHAVPDQPTGWPLTNMQATPMYAVPAATTVIPSTYNRRIPSLPAVRAIEEPTEKLEAFVERLNEATPANSIVFNLGDENTRGIKYFRIVDGNEDGKFAMNEETGTVTTVSSFDREQKDIYTLSIEARSKQPDQLLYYTLLQIYITDANDNAPEFEGGQPIKLNLKLDDLSQLGPNWKIGRVLVHDKDKDENGRISLRILEPLNQLFTIEHNGDLSINGELTSQHLGEHRLSVIATDNGDPPLESRALILITIEGDASRLPSSSLPSPPIPSVADSLRSGSYSNSVSESGSAAAVSSSSSSVDYESGSDSRKNSAEKAMAFFSRATLPPPTANSNTDAPPFTRIDPRTGSFQSIVSTTSNGVPLPIYSPPPAIYNSPSATYYTSSIPPPARLAPIFPIPLITVVVEENEEDLELCTLEAKYPDGQPGSITYVMQTGDETLFSLNNHTGKLTLLKALDAEAEQTYSLTIGTLESMVNNQDLTMDPNQPHSATIVVQVMDVNDWIPNFEQDLYEFKIIDKAEPSTVVGQVTAYDQDAKPPNNNIRYKILNTDGLELLFSVDAATGMIKVARAVNGFSGKKLELKVEARDQGEVPQSTQTLVVVEVEASAQEIENTADTQSTLSYTTTGGERGENGGLEVGQLPFSTTAKPDLPVHQGTLRFSSRNYNASILEGSRAPAFVQILELLNKPADARFIQCAISSGNYRSAFHVPLNADGNCELRTMFELDREVVEHYLLNVSVQHGVHTDSTLVSVHVLDQNDNHPKFIYPTMSPSNGLDLAGYFTAISSTAPANTKVLQVKAVDADVGDNSLVHYELDAGSADAKYFTVDRDSGQMVNRKRMQDVAGKNRKSHFDVLILACDSGEDKLCSKTHVFVNLIADQHRFVTVVKGADPKMIKEHVGEMAKGLRQYTGLCSWLELERMAEGEPSNKPSPTDNIILGGGSSGGHDETEPVTKLYWYAANPSTKKICRKQEFSRLLFNSTTKEQLSNKLQQWFTLEEIRPVLSSDATADGFEFFEDGTSWLPIDWKSASTVLVLISIGVAIVAVFALCAILVFRSKHRGNHKRGRSMPRNYPSVYPKYNDNVYLPNLGNGAHFIGNPIGTEERTNKFYETQMLELPISDEDFTLLKNNNRNVGGRGGLGGYGRPVNHLATSNHHLYNQQDVGGTAHSNTHRTGYPTRTTQDQCSFYGTGGGSGNGSGVPNRANRVGSAAMSRPIYASQRHLQDDCDFSIEENMYAINPPLNRMEQQNPSKLIF